MKAELAQHCDGTYSMVSLVRSTVCVCVCLFAFTVRKVIFVFKNSGNKMYSVNAHLLLNT